MKAVLNDRDAQLIEGVHDYIVGSLPWAWRMLGFLVGFHGDKERGIRTVVLHTGLAKVGLPPSLRNPSLPRDPRAAATKPSAGLLLRRRRIPGAVVYTVLHVDRQRAR